MSCCVEGEEGELADGSSLVWSEGEGSSESLTVVDSAGTEGYARTCFVLPQLRPRPRPLGI